MGVTEGPLRMWRMPERDLGFLSFGFGEEEDFFPAGRPFPDFPMNGTQEIPAGH